MSALSVAATGLDGQQKQLDAIANNLANVSTNGYKRSRTIFADLIYQNVRQAGARATQNTDLATGLQLGTGTRAVASQRIFSQGTLSAAGERDLAINGNGFFQVQLPDGTTAYTRDGSFQTNAQGQLVTVSGNPLIPAITIPQGITSITVSVDGTVSVLQPGNINPTNIGQIQLATFVNPGGLQALGGNLYQETGSSGTPQTGVAGTAGFGEIQQGYVEASNVNIVEEMVAMIKTQRSYDTNAKVLETAKQTLEKLAQV